MNLFPAHTDRTALLMVGHEQGVIGREVRVTVTGVGEHAINVSALIRTHKIYPGCQNSPVAAARYDPATDGLVGTDWTFGRD